MIKYKEAIEHIEVTDEMRSHILNNIPEKIKEPEEPLKPAPRRQLSIYVLIVPIITVAAAALLVWMILPQFLAGGGSSGKSAAVSKDQGPTAAFNESCQNNTAAEAAEEELGMAGIMYEISNEAAPAAGEADGVAADPENMIMYDSVTSFKTGTALEGAVYPSAVLITGRSELLEKYVSKQGLDEGDVSDYDDAFFENSDLVIVLLEEPSGSITHEINGIWTNGTDSSVIDITRNVPEVRTDDMAYWYYFIETGKGLVGENIEVNVE